jgi:hypothetical protein
LVSRKNDNELTPEGRLAAVARELVVEMYHSERLRRDGLQYPNVPDYADFADRLRLYVRRELIQARLDLAKLISPLGIAKALSDELKRVEIEIAKFEKAEP